jgi:hypothetical protein
MNSNEVDKRKRISEINEKWYRTAAKNHDEESTIREFIYPLLEALGWNLATDLKREVNNIDCVLYLENKPHIGIEAKSLSYGVLDEKKDGVIFNRNRLLENCHNIGVKWAILSRYAETIIYNVKNGEKIAFFTHPNEYIDKLKKLAILQKGSS